MNWFSFHDALYASERVLHFLNQTRLHLPEKQEKGRTTGCTFGEGREGILQ